MRKISKKKLIKSPEKNVSDTDEKERHNQEDQGVECTSYQQQTPRRPRGDSQGQGLQGQVNHSQQQKKNASSTRRPMFNFSDPGRSFTSNAMMQQMQQVPSEFANELNVSRIQ